MSEYKNLIIDDREQQIDKAAVKESLMDFVGHFSTASAILTGFYITTCVFIIGIKASITDPDTFAFLDAPLLENNIIGITIKDFLNDFSLAYLWPSNFQYMVLIFIILFILSLFSYAMFIWVGLLQMSNYRDHSDKKEKKIITWVQRGMNTLFISLIFSFISLPWAMLRFIVDEALSASLLLIIIIIVFIIILLLLLRIIRRK